MVLLGCFILLLNGRTVLIGETKSTWQRPNLLFCSLLRLLRILLWHFPLITTSKEYYHGVCVLLTIVGHQMMSRFAQHSSHLASYEALRPDFSSSVKDAPSRLSMTHFSLWVKSRRRVSFFIFSHIGQGRTHLCWWSSGEIYSDCETEASSYSPSY